jgi:hypothetical protein
MDIELIYLLLIYSFTGICMLGTIIVRTYMKKDFSFMKYKPFKNKCDIWCLSHFFMYCLLGYLAPKYWVISFVLSILWEYIEVYLEKRNIYISSNVKDDIITNSLGLLIGIILSFS